MDFLELAKKRYSVRKFSEKKVPEDVVKKIIEAGRVAPTARNNQPQIIYAIESEEALAKLQNVKSQHFDETLAFVVCYDSTKCWKRDSDGVESGYVDASIVATHMMLEAAELGVGSTWMMKFDAEATKKEFDMEENLVPVCILAMGYEEEYKPSDRHTIRKPVEDIVRFK